MTMTLAEFLTARLDEDQEDARYALEWAIDAPGLEHDWQWVHCYKPVLRQHGWSTEHLPGCPSPARVLAEVEAKRRIVSHLGGPGVGDPNGPILRHLALPYVDHPNYRQEWRR